jgi:hypothetical protein
MVSQADLHISGIGEGAGLPFITVLAMNLRQEISMGLEADGCTSFAWKTDDVSLLAQNWDVSPPITVPSYALLTLCSGKKHNK